MIKKLMLYCDRLKRFVLMAALALAISTLGVSGEAVASVTFTATGSDTDGPLAATITFTAINGGIEITFENDATGTIRRGQAISTLEFTISGLSTPTAFTTLTGRSINSTAIGSGGSWTSLSGTAFIDTSNAPPVNAIDHWGFEITGSSVLLATADSPVPGAANPHYMVLPSSGTAGPGGSFSNGNFDPYIIGPAVFTLTVPGVTSSTILSNSNFSSVVIGFGTGPDTFLDGVPGEEPPQGAPPIAAPEPASLIVWSLLAAAVGVATYRRRSLA